MDHVNPIDHVRPAGPVESPANRRPDQSQHQGPESAEFRRILERLEEISRKEDIAAGTPSDVATVDHDAMAPRDRTSDTRATRDLDETQRFLDAVQKADDDFASVMDLRQRLEEAYRRTRS